MKRHSQRKNKISEAIIARTEVSLQDEAPQAQVLIFPTKAGGPLKKRFLPEGEVAEFLDIEVFRFRKQQKEREGWAEGPVFEPGAGLFYTWVWVPMWRNS